MKDLIQESVFGSNDGAKAMIQQSIMALAAQGIGEVSTSMIAQELRNKLKLDVPYAELMDILNEIPLVGSADSDTVTLRDDSDVEAQPGEESAEEQVADMATNGVKADDTF